MTRTSASALCSGRLPGPRWAVGSHSILGPTCPSVASPDKTLGKSTPIVRLLSAVAHHSLTVQTPPSLPWWCNVSRLGVTMNASIETAISCEKPQGLT